MEELEQYSTTDKLSALDKTCKDCSYFMQVKGKGYCRKEYSSKEPNETICDNSLFY